ncbi:MAG: shikimate kinase [Bdellovibrionales bacterium]
MNRHTHKKTDTGILDKPIMLVGMMGTGKSHIGKALAAHLEVGFYDSDDEIIKAGGLSINEIFELYGEAKFRETESRTILALMEKTPCVIATGGGCLTTPSTLQAVKDKALSIWLQTDIPHILKRLEHARNRPLLQSDDPQSVLEDLMAKRKHLYAQADIHITTHENDTHETLRRVIDAMTG